MRARRLVGAALGFVLLGCGGEVEPADEDAEGTAVWSDDDLGIVAVLEWFDDGVRRHEVILADDQGRLERTLTEATPGFVHDVFFMRSAGYVLVIGLLNPGSDPTWFVDRIDLDGTVTRIYEQPTHWGWLLPAPDGSAIARIRYFDTCDALDGETGTCTLEVEMLDPSSGDPVAAPLPLIFGPIDGVERFFPDWVFHPSGHLVLSDGVLTYEVSLAGELVGDPEATPPPACFLPRTSSSDISRAGRTVSWDRFADRLVLTPPEAPGYPDRCFAAVP